MNLALPLGPLAEVALDYRQQCTALDQLAEELYREVEHLQDELVRKADELEHARHKLVDRGGQDQMDGLKLLHLLEQQETRLSEALREIKQLREQVASEREEARQREATHSASLEHKLRAAEAEREQLKHELHVLQATAAPGTGGSESLAPLMSELGDLRRQLGETLGQLGETRTQLAAAIERSAAAHLQNLPVTPADKSTLDEDSRSKLESLSQERVELEAELELVRTRAVELQEIVNQQRRELAEQRADVTSEIRSLREVIQQQIRHIEEGNPPEHEAALATVDARNNDNGAAAPDPVVSSVMAQFARLQKDVAQRRKKK
jgi:chromosome segregation ATPase